MLTSLRKHFINQSGLAPLILLTIVAVGILAFLAFSQAADFKSGVFKTLFSKKSSFASDPGILFVDSSNNPISQAASANVRLQLTSPWSLQNQGGFSLNLVPEALAQTQSSVMVKATSTANEVDNAFESNKSTFWLGTGGSATNSWTGLTFANVSIPKGSKISSAKLEVYSSQSQWIGVGALINGDNVSSSPAFNTNSRPSKRALTQSQVTHSSNSKWDANKYYEFSDVTPIVQELVNRSDWNSGNSLSLIFKGNLGTFGRKFAKSNGSNAPKLTITYTTSGTTPPPTTAPTSNPTTKPTLAPTVAPTVVPTVPPTPAPYVVSAKVAEDNTFTKNVKEINPFNSNPAYLDYTFSDTTSGTKTVYAKFVSSTGEEKVYSSSITLGSAATPAPSGMGNMSMAMMAWRVGGKNAPNPAYDKCDDGTDIVTAHNAYYVIAYDGIMYPTWHPPVVVNPITGVGKCYFGHEHGTDPQKYAYWNDIVTHFGQDQNGDGQITAMVIGSDGKITPGDHAGIPFGIANEHMDKYYNLEGRDSLFVRHEDHVGHKIELVNNEAETQGNSTHTMAQLPNTVGISVPYYKSGTNTYQPTGVVCAHLHKFHQGTNSADAVRNNLHETIFHSSCQSVDVAGINAPAYYPTNKVLLTGMTSFGMPGEYKRFCFNDRFTKVCADGQNPDGSCVISDPLISKLPPAINSQSLGRNMVDKYCFDNFAALNPGINYFNPYEIWEGDFGIYTPGGKQLVEHGRQWDVLDPVRYVDASLPNGIGYNQDRCNQGLPYSGNCDRGVHGAAWNSPQAAFKGLVRTTYFGRNRIQNAGGATIWWTDPIGSNATTTQFASGLKQMFSSVDADIQKVQYRIQQLYGSDNFLNDRAIQRSFNDGGGTVHAPN